MSTAPYRSHRTQVLLNYFDAADQRVREEPYTIDAQLLNTAAMALDDSQQRIERELAALLLATCPSGLDNGGSYYAIAIPNEFVLGSDQATLDLVTGITGTSSTILKPYDDRLPVPSAMLEDTARSRVAFTSPILFDITGTGDATNLVWDMHDVGPFALAVPNRLTFWAEGIEGNHMALDIFVQGDQFPKPVWASQQTGASETISQADEGIFTGAKIWQNVTSMVIRGLDAGVRLRCWQLPVNVPAVLDADRPYTHPVFRDVLFDRYWAISARENLLKELFMMDNFSTLEYAQSYAMSVPFNALCVEPHTWGMFAASGANVTYFDRREPLPLKLNVTAMTLEPLYGLDVCYDVVHNGAVRYVALRPVDYGGASNLSHWRYLIEDPQCNDFVLMPDGSLAAYTGAAGWQGGKPIPLSIPLVQTGTYVITIECMGMDGVLTADNFPYPNFAAPTGASFDLSGILPGIQGLAFDALEQLWAWTGDYLVPLKVRYDAYLLDAANRMLYLTDTYDTVQYQ